MMYENSNITKRNIYTEHLISGQPYQRPVKDHVVNKLIREWDSSLMEPLTVSYRDGRFYLVDGQHRVSALRRMNGGMDVVVACKLYHGLTYEQEAELCYKLDQAKKSLSRAESTIALVEAGTDTEVNEILRLLVENGFTWALGKWSGQDYEIVASRTLINAYRFLGGAAFGRMLMLMREAWHGEPYSLKADFISGMALFLKTYGAELDDRAAIKRLSAINPVEVIRRGKMDFSTNRAALRYARVILDRYNSQRGGRKLEYKYKG